MTQPNLLELAERLEAYAPATGHCIIIPDTPNEDATRVLNRLLREAAAALRALAKEEG